MKIVVLSIFLTLFISIHSKSQTGAKIQRISVQSTFKANKEFLNCEAAKQTLIDTNTCNTKGSDDTAICDEYEKKMEKELDCKMECKEFYKKYYKITMETKKKQAKLYKENKKEDDLQAIEFEMEQMKNSEEAMIKMNCMGDDLIPDNKDDQKKDKKKEKK